MKKDEVAKMLTIEYAGYGVSVPDHEVKKFAIDTIKRYKNPPVTDVWIAVSNKLVIKAFRNLVVKEEISYKEICFHFDNTDILIDKYGSPHNWPTGFCE